MAEPKEHLTHAILLPFQLIRLCRRLGSATTRDRRSGLVIHEPARQPRQVAQ